MSLSIRKPSVTQYDFFPLLQPEVDLGDFENNTTFALYDNFAVNSEDDGFRLTAEGYSGTAGWYILL